MTLTAPADGGTECLSQSRTVTAEPRAVCQDGASLAAYYTCPGCGHRWRTWWNPIALGGAA